MYCYLQYNEDVVRRQALLVEARGERFRFYYDLEHPTVLHLTRRHGTTPEDAVRTFFTGVTAPWDEGHQRFETRTETHSLYWTRHAHDQSVIVISCFERGEEPWPDPTPATPVTPPSPSS